MRRSFQLSADQTTEVANAAARLGVSSNAVVRGCVAAHLEQLTYEECEAAQGAQGREALRQQRARQKAQEALTRL